MSFHEKGKLFCAGTISSTVAVADILLEDSQVGRKMLHLRYTCARSGSLNSLNNWNELCLSATVKECFENAGINRLFKWQTECLLTENVLENGRNLIFTAPTSAGKSLVAEILILNRVVKCRKKALYILPYISVAREKLVYLQGSFRKADVRVDGFIGNSNATGGLSTWDVAICTIEKANNLINHLIEDREIDKIGIIVVDELHSIGDNQRGYLLELLITKLSFCSAKFGFSLQIVGMSATLPNINVIAEWLNAALYCTTYRPVPLTEHVFCDGKFYNVDRKVVRILPTEMVFSSDADNVVS